MERGSENNLMDPQPLPWHQLGLVGSAPSEKTEPRSPPSQVIAPNAYSRQRHHSLRESILKEGSSKKVCSFTRHKLALLDVR